MNKLLFMNIQLADWWQSSNPGEDRRYPSTNTVGVDSQDHQAQPNSYRALVWWQIFPYCRTTGRTKPHSASGRECANSTIRKLLNYGRWRPAKVFPYRCTREKFCGPMNLRLMLVTSGDRRLGAVESRIPNCNPKFTIKTVKHPALRRLALEMLQQGGAPCYTTKIVKHWLCTSEVECFHDWPSSSPDVSPFKKPWAIVKNKLRGEDTSTMAEVVVVLRRAWSSISPSTLRILADSIQDRILEQRRLKGYSINK